MVQTLANNIIEKLDDLTATTKHNPKGDKVFEHPEQLEQKVGTTSNPATVSSGFGLGGGGVPNFD